MYTCPVCGYGELDEDPTLLTYEICIRCGVEFGYEPVEAYPRIREEWIAAGKPFWQTDSNWKNRLAAGFCD